MSRHDAVSAHLLRPLEDVHEQLMHDLMVAHVMQFVVFPG